MANAVAMVNRCYFHQNRDLFDPSVPYIPEERVTENNASSERIELSGIILPQEPMGIPQAPESFWPTI